MENSKIIRLDSSVPSSYGGNEAGGGSQHAGSAAPSEEQISWPAQTSAPISGSFPLSPTAADIIRQVDYPTCPSLGMTEISIPLYTVKAGDLEVPISISYRSSGIKVDEIAGPVGLG